MIIKRNYFFYKIINNKACIVSLFIVLFLFKIKPHIHAEKVKDFNWFWMFYENEIDGNNRTMVFRPFYLKTGTTHKYFQGSLMPVFFWRYKTPRRDEWRGLFGFSNSVNYLHEKKKKDFDFGLFPLVFFGLGPDKRDKYFFLWPFGGTIKGKFAVEKISAYLFPGFLLFVFFPPSSILSYMTLVYFVASIIPVFLKYEFKDFKGYGIFWPVIYWGKGKKRDDVRVLPFYSHLHKKGWYDKYSFLMIFNYHKIYYSKDEHEMFFFFPFFGKKWSRTGRISAVTILWPLFSWGYDKRTGDNHLNILWPFMQIQDCEKPKIKKRIFFPFAGIYKRENEETEFYTPLYFRMSKKSLYLDSEQRIFFVIFWYFTRKYLKETNDYYGNNWKLFKIWPLLSIEFNDMGDASFNLLSALPFRDIEGYEKMYEPFWSILEFRKFRDGEKRLGLFMRFYYQRWGKNFLYIRMPVLMSYGRKEGKLTELTFLLYMFGYTRNSEGRKIRLFWIPISLKKDRRGDDQTGMNDAGKDDTVSNFSHLKIDRFADYVNFTHSFF